MTQPKAKINLSKFDVHVIQSHEYYEIPELTEEFNVYNNGKLVSRGRPRVAKPKKLKSFKLAQDVIDAIVASGKAYNARVEAVLRTAFVGGH